MNTTPRAALHLGKDYYMNLRYAKNHLWKTLGQHFKETERVVSRTETTSISLINFQDFKVGIDELIAQSSSPIFHCQTLVISDSVLYLGKMGDDPVESWKEQIEWYSGNNYFFCEFNRTDGQPMEFEWKIFPGFTTMVILNEIQQMMGELQCDSENYTGRIIFMSMFKDIVWDAKGNDEICENNSKTNENYARRFLSVIGLSWSLDLKRSGTELTIANHMDLGTELQRKCCSTSQDLVILHSVIPVPCREENQEAKEVERHQ